MDSPRRELSKRIRALIEAGEMQALREMLVGIASEEIEESFDDLDAEERQFVLRHLETETAAEVLGGVDEHIQEELAEGLSESELAVLLEEMESDEAADTVRHLERDEQDRVLDLLEEDTESEVRELLRHEEDTAGDLMMAEFAAVHESAIIAEAIELIRENADEYRELYNVWVVDDARRLLGTLSLRDMVLARPGMPLKSVMGTVTARVTPEMDQEEVANLFRKYDVVSMPVVDADGVLVGRITVDDVLDVMEEEASEDLSRFAGLGNDDAFRPLSLLRLSRSRLPWLALGLLGGLISGRILQSFQGSIAAVLEIAFFIPVIMALAGNIGIQSSTIIVRGLATGEVTLNSVRSRIAREIAVSIINAGAIGALAFFVALFWLREPNLGLVVSCSMLIVAFWATLTGTFIPLLLQRVGVDPAYATGPFLTTTNDIVALTIYMSIAYAFRSHLI